jgi:hypothetical protein
LDQKFSKQPKQDSLRFADVNTARMKPEEDSSSLHILQTHLCKKKLFFSYL